MNITIHLIKEDLLNASRLHAKKPFWMRLSEYFFRVILCVFFYELTLALAGYSQFWSGSAGMGLIILIYVINRLVIYPRRLDRIFKSSPELQEPTETIFS